MRLLIDGYNVIHLTGMLGRRVGPGSLERSRQALLNFLAGSLEPGERERAVVVFDAHDPPADRPRTYRHQGILVRFAERTTDADSLIEELIREESAPRRLTVVSSDRRIQRAARRRKARPVDANTWYAELSHRRRVQAKKATQGPAKPPVPLLEEDVHYWLRRFGYDPKGDEPG